ncbi:MAG: DUF1223 domain-containing protein [Rhizobiales bacterium]|nr:DUF1223 domain-containing protein [Hyphomicrobiales bacterium]
MKPIVSLSRRRALTLAAAGVAMAGLGRPAVSAAGARAAVVELFTSQGCSSCPPADAFLAELQATKDVIALSYHVDYWDYLGWKDTLGDPENSQRQYDYAHARGDMDVYTPQMIVDGRSHFVGSSRPVVLDAIARAQAAPPGVPLSLRNEKMELVVDIGRGADVGETTLWLMSIVPRVSVKILKGEIAGKEIVYRNVVRGLMAAGMWNGEAKTLRLPKDGVLTSDSKGCVALLQQGKVGPVLAAATWGEV